MPKANLSFTFYLNININDDENVILHNSLEIFQAFCCRFFEL